MNSDDLIRKIVQLENEIEELQRPVCVATDEGTHGQPYTVEVLERLDGIRYGQRRFAGGPATEFDASNGSPYGRMRRLTHEPATARRKRLKEAQAELKEARDFMGSLAQRASESVLQALEYDRLNDVTMRNQVARSIYDLPGATKTYCDAVIEHAGLGCLVAR